MKSIEERAIRAYLRDCSRNGDQPSVSLTENDGRWLILKNGFRELARYEIVKCSRGIRLRKRECGRATQNCVHEAGHAFVSAELGVPFLFVETTAQGGGRLQREHVENFSDKEWMLDAAVIAGGPRAQIKFFPQGIAKRHIEKLKDSFLNIGALPMGSSFGLFLAWQGDIEQMRQNEFAKEGEELCKDVLAAPHATAAITAIADALAVEGKLDSDRVLQIVDEAEWAESPGNAWQCA